MRFPSFGRSGLLDRRARVACAALLTVFGATITSAQAPEPTRKELLERDGIIWGTRAAWITPFEENIGEDLKIAGLSRFWMEAKLNFPRFAEVADLDWDKTFIDFLPRVRATKSTYEYYKVLQEMCALLRDAHSDVFLPPELARRMEATPPLQLDLIERRVFITRVGSASLEAAGVAAGLEILKVDGLSVREHADRFRRPYVGSNTAAHRELTIFSSGLLAGPLEAPVELSLRAKDGRTFTRKIARTGYTDVANPAAFEVRRLPGNVAYVAINSFADDGVEKEFERALPDLRRSDGVVLDVRENAGGSGVVAYDIIGDLSDRDFSTPRWRSREYIATFRAWGTAGGWYEQKPETAMWKGKGAESLAKPVVLLTGPRSLSATDVFAETFKSIGRGPVVGEPTGGGVGDPLAFALPGGGTARVSTSGEVGRGIVGVGVIPDVVVPRTAEDYLAGRDAALEAGIAALRRLIAAKSGGV